MSPWSRDFLILSIEKLPSFWLTNSYMNCFKEFIFHFLCLVYKRGMHLLCKTLYTILHILSACKARFQSMEFSHERETQAAHRPPIVFCKRCSDLGSTSRDPSTTPSSTKKYALLLLSSLYHTLRISRPDSSCRQVIHEAKVILLILLLFWVKINPFN